ncbi:response regulator transcription factor [Intrasporangium sp.]|uniref:response regulator transcription factor n=1 Tax=Intrasporangium sp. TaxID=1925024 RepID=UPI00293A461C|nr:response regulator transcription factor [Intrasporangium sp.]MDV3221158.1 response regulator transcription factor [Intrasporangium sp.]
MTDARAFEDIAVMVVDDHAVVRQGLITFLGNVSGVRVVAQAPDGQAALDELARMATMEELPDVVLMDLQMPRLDGVAATQAISARYPHLKVVVLSSFGEVGRVQAALAAGASGYVLKDAEPDDITAAIRSAINDQVHLDPTVARRLTQRMITPEQGLSALTARERDILALVASGMSNKQIAAHLTISERTARTHVSNVLAKMHLTSRTQAALVAVREGLVTPDGLVVNDSRRR